MHRKSQILAAAVLLTGIGRVSHAQTQEFEFPADLGVDATPEQVAEAFDCQVVEPSLLEVSDEDLARLGGAFDGVWFYQSSRPGLLQCKAQRLGREATVLLMVNEERHMIALGFQWTFEPGEALSGDDEQFFRRIVRALEAKYGEARVVAGEESSGLRHTAALNFPNSARIFVEHDSVDRKVGVTYTLPEAREASTAADAEEL